MSEALRIGIDLVAVDSVRASVDEYGEHYLRRIYTEAELADCATPSGLDYERLGARFAAKEATLKVLRPDDHGIPWTEIEVRRHRAGWVELELSGAASALALREGVGELALSLTHEGGFASAVVIADCASGTDRTIR